MSFRIVTRVLAISLIPFVGAIAGPDDAHADGVPSGPVVGCEMKANDPHVSSSGKGIDAKSTATCKHRHKKLEINPALYKCDHGKRNGRRPSENWIFDNCDFVAWAFHSWSPQLASRKYTGQVPRKGGEEVHGKGWYVQDTVFATHYAGGKVLASGRTSHVVYLNG